jgi:hypothetical protein
VKHLALILALCLCLSVPCSALTLFNADYDADEWTTETVYEGEWLPLRELSSILPYTVEWKDRTIYIYADRTWTIKPDWYLPEGVKIVDGVTYVTPKYMKHILPNSFMHDGELYVLNGAVESKLIRGSERFKRNAVTSLYHMKVATPEAYSMVRECLTGGVESVKRPDFAPVNTAAYTYPSRRKPTAYIIGEPSGTVLAGRIVHEAFHVRQYREGREISEKEAEEYSGRVMTALLETK